MLIISLVADWLHKKPTQIEGIPNKSPKNLSGKDQEDDPNYESLEDSEHTETSLAKDGRLPIASGARPSDPQPKTMNALVDSPRRKLSMLDP